MIRWRLPEASRGFVDLAAGDGGNTVAVVGGGTDGAGVVGKVVGGELGSVTNRSASHDSFVLLVKIWTP